MSGQQRRLVEPNYTYGHEGPTTLTNASALIFSNTSGQPMEICKLAFTDIDSAARTITVRDEVTGAALGTTARNILMGEAIAADEYLEFVGDGDKPFYVLEDGHSIYAFASANSAVNIHIDHRTIDR